MNVIKLILRNLDGFRTKFILILIVGGVIGACSFGVVLTLTEFTKQGLTLNKFYHSVPVLLGVYCGYLLFAWIMRKYGEAMAAQFENHIRFKYFRRLETLPAERMVKLHSGYILSLFNQIGAAMYLVLFNSFWSLTAGITQLTLFFIFVSRESWEVAIVNLGVLIVFVSLSTYLAQKMVVVNKELNLKRASLLESYADFITNIFTIKKLAIYAFAEQKLKSKTAENFRQINKVQKQHAKRWFILHSLYASAYMGTVIYFLYLVAQGKESLAVLILFVSVYSSVRYHMERLSETLKVVMETKAYVDNVDALLEGAGQTENAVEEIEWQQITITNAELTYHENQRHIFVPDFYLKKGEIVCVEGVSGQGKTTLLQILVNAYNPQKGERYFGAIPYESLPREFFDRTMVMISQEVELFNISLRDNIMLGQDIPEDRIWEILGQMDLVSWIKNLDNGLDTIVGEKGIRLSAGQKQRINLIRALLLDREIYLLDEPTSHLDVKTEAKVVEFLKNFLQGKTVVIVTHRPELRQICSRSYIFNNHELRELKP
jgi:ABC-type bacteriocin/lantibiotic exporter with double-glycine peptidase domain